MGNIAPFANKNLRLSQQIVLSRVLWAFQRQYDRASHHVKLSIAYRQVLQHGNVFDGF